MGAVNTQEASGRGRPPAPPVLSVSAPGSSAATSGKKQAAKSKEELAQEKKKELEKRLQDVSGQLSNNKKPAKKGTVWAEPLPGCGTPVARTAALSGAGRVEAGSGWQTQAYMCGSTTLEPRFLR